MRIRLAGPALLFALLAGCMPAGHQEPLILRMVTLGDRSGPAYYSRVEQGYRFVALPSDAASRIAVAPDETESRPVSDETVETRISSVN